MTLFHSMTNLLFNNAASPDIQIITLCSHPIFITINLSDIKDFTIAFLVNPLFKKHFNILEQEW